MCEIGVAVSVLDRMLMFNNGCVRTRLILLYIGINYSAVPDSAPGLSLFTAPPTASIMSRFFWQLRNGDVDSVSRKSSKYKLSYPGPQGAVIIFPLRPPIEPHLSEFPHAST